MFKKSLNEMDATIFAFGNGGLNIAIDLANSNIFEKYSIQYYDYNLEENEKKIKELELPIIGGFRYELMESKDRMKDLILFSDELTNDGYPYGLSKNVIICATLGGKCGSELSPYFALAATLQGRFVCSLYSIPSKFEGENRIMTALDSAQKLEAASSIAIEQNNEELKSMNNLKFIDMNLPLIQTFIKIYQNNQFNLSENNEFLTSLIPSEYKKTHPSLITIHNNGYKSTTYKQRIKNFER